MPVADTGFVVAVAITTDKWHHACLEIYRHQTEINLPQSVLTEVGYLLTELAGNKVAAKFLRNLPRTKYRSIVVESVDLARTADLLEQYENIDIDFTDCTVVAIAERLKMKQILTIDHRDFSIIRPRHVDYFELLPPTHSFYT